MSKHLEEFKLVVVRHYLSGLGGYRATANKFGISHSLVRKWLDIHNFAQPDGAERGSSHRSAQFKLYVLETIQTEELSLREACKRFNIAAASSNWCGKNDMLKVAEPPWSVSPESDRH
jgi:transposase